MKNNNEELGDLDLSNQPKFGLPAKIASVLFILVLLAIVAAGIFLSRSIAYDTQAIDIAGRQRMLSQSIAKNVAILNNKTYSQDQQYFTSTIASLRNDVKTFDDTLKGFLNGGDTSDTRGGTATLKIVQSSQLRQYLTEAENKWNALEPNFKQVVNSSEGTVSPDEIQLLEQKVSAQNLDLRALMNSLTVGLKEESTQKTSYQTYLSVAALLSTLLFFAYLFRIYSSNTKKRDDQLVKFSERLRDNNMKLEKTNIDLVSAQNELTSSLDSLEVSKNDAVDKATELETLANNLTRLQDESDKIFSTVDHGLCLLTPDLKIGDRISKATFDIFEKENLSGVSFLNLMRPLVSDKDLSTLSSFLKLQFEGKTLASQLDKYNPLKTVEMTLDWDGNTFKNKHVGFEFERIMNGDTVEQVLVTITDITQRVVLEKNIEQIEKEQTRNSDIIMELMTVDQAEFNRVVVQSERAVNEINELLRDKNISSDKEIPSELRVKIVNEVFRKVHTIKGNASMVGMSQLAGVAEEVEEDLSSLKKKSSLTGESLLGALVSLSSLRELIDGYHDIKDSFMDKFQSNTKKATQSLVQESEESKIKKQLNEFGARIGLEEGKKIQVVANLDLFSLNKDKVDKIKDIYTQLLRNSVVHGIESPEDRLKKGKLEEGIIYISSQKIEEDSGNEKIKFTFRDDGRGLDLDLIKKHVIEKGIVPADAPELDDPKFLAKMIFTPNFSTQDEVSEHAGRGVGMDVMRSTIVNELDGKMSMSYSKGNYTEFSWVIPFTDQETN